MGKPPGPPEPFRGIQQPSAAKKEPPPDLRPIPVLHVSLGLLLTIAALGGALACQWPIFYGLAFGFVLFLGLSMKAGYTWRALLKASLHSLYRIRNVLMMLALVGMMIPLWMQTGVLASLMAYSIDAFSGFNLAVAAFLSSVAVSMLLGSGVGTVSTVGLVFLAIGRSVGISDAMIAGAVVSGAYFGDRTSPMSSNFNLVTEITGTNLRENLIYMLSSTLPVFIMTSMFYGFWGPEATEGQAQALTALRQLLAFHFDIRPVQLIPPGVMLFFVLILRQNMVVSLSAALVLSLGSGLLGGGFDWAPLLTGLEATGPLGVLLSGSGLMSMANALLIISISAALSGIFQLTNCLDPLLRKASSRLTTKGRLILSTGAISLLISLISGNQTMTTLIAGNYFKDRYDDFKVDRRLLARTISDTGVVSVPLIPWNINGILVATLTGVATLDYLPYALNSWMLPVLTVWFAFRGRAINLKESARSAAIIQAVAAHKPLEKQRQSGNTEK